MRTFIIFAVIVLIGAFGLILFQRESSPMSKISNAIPTKTIQKTMPSSSKQTIQPTSSDTMGNNVDVKQTAIIKTEKGDIALSLYPNDAPKTVANFIQKAKSGFYDNLTFHRVEDWVIQGGDPKGNGRGGGNIPTELNDKPFVVGSLGVARGADIRISNDAQFFITKTDASWLNSQYTNLGIVTRGIDVVNKIEIGDKILGIELH